MTVKTEGTEVHSPHKMQKENSIVFFFSPTPSSPLPRLGEKKNLALFAGDVHMRHTIFLIYHPDIFIINYSVTKHKAAERKAIINV